MKETGTTPREMPLLIGAGDESPESLLMIGEPDAAGRVQLRAWTSDEWSAPPRSRSEQASELLAWLESQARSGRTMNQSLYALRLWLRGEGDAIP